MLGDFHLLDLLTQRSTISIGDSHQTLDVAKGREMTPAVKTSLRSQARSAAYLVPYLPVTPTSVNAN
jgi:hypothetical protein